MTIPRREDIDLLTAGERLRQWRHRPIDLGTPATVPHVGVNRVGEVDGRGADREVNDMATRGEHIDPLVKGDLLEALDQIRVKL